MGSPRGRRGQGPPCGAPRPPEPLGPQACPLRPANKPLAAHLAGWLPGPWPGSRDRRSGDRSGPCVRRWPPRATTGQHSGRRWRGGDSRGTRAPRGCGRGPGGRTEAAPPAPAGTRPGPRPRSSDAPAGLQAEGRARRGPGSPPGPSTAGRARRGHPGSLAARAGQEAAERLGRVGRPCLSDGHAEELQELRREAEAGGSRGGGQPQQKRGRGQCVRPWP